MFFEISPKEHDNLFSYVIIKHPDNIFERDIGSGRKVIAHFDETKKYYHGYVENDPIQFLKTARHMNLSNYVHTQLSAVCPHNLMGLDETFRTAIRGNFKDENKQIYNHSLKEQDWCAFIGPYPCKLEIIQEWFDLVDIDAKPYINQFDKLNLGLNDYEFMVYNINFETKREMSITEFLQKIYLISYYLTIRKELRQMDNDRISKFVSFCSNWIERIDGHKRNRLINTLSGYRKSNIQKFENLLIDESELDNEEKDVKRNEVEEFIKRKGLHQKRHELIKNIINHIKGHNNTLIDLGCGSGQFLKYIDKHINNFNMLGIEVNSKRTNKTSLRSKKNNINIKNSSGLNPNIRITDLNPSYLVCTEVLEHLEKQDRINLINLIKDFYKPEVFILTVPNIDYNKYIPGLLDENGNYNGKYRHNDHKIEYTKEELENEVVSILNDKYDCQWYNVIDGENEQPSFVLSFVKNKEDSLKEKEKQYQIYNKISKLYNPVHLPVSNYEIREKELEKGYSSNAFIRNSKNIFYLAPTMAPTDSSFSVKYQSDQYIEHPITAIDYFNQRGINDLYAEEKYMGSRAYVLIFNNMENAIKAGYDNDIIVNSRGGFPFFNSEEDLNKIDWKNIQKNMTTDFISFDCEIMPWNYKAQKLIDFDFVVPGECTYLSRRYGNYGNVDYAKEYLKILNSYNNENNFEVRIFNILASGDLFINKRYNKFQRYTNVNIGVFKDIEWHYNLIEEITKSCTKIKPVIHYKLNSNKQWDIDHVIYQWKQYTEEKNGEGFVIKPKYGVIYTNDGYMIQPSIKVRGSKYLQLVYGIDYMDKNYFDMVKHRKIVKKRKLAILQHELGINILRSWLKGDEFNRKKYIASFLGSEEANIKGIDATL